MSQNVCPQCGAPLDPGATECKYCGEKIVSSQSNQQTGQSYQQNAAQSQVSGSAGTGNTADASQSQPQQTVIINNGPAATVYTGINPAWPVKSKVVAGLLAIFLGGLGIHKFYLGKTGMGILYLCFCWTGVPEVVGFIEGLIYLFSNKENFQLKHHVRLK